MKRDDPDDPKSWTIGVPQDRIDLYLELLEVPRALAPEEAIMMVDLVNGWRALEQRKHMALMTALSSRRDPGPERLKG